jgi:hypothetical protein
MTSQPPPMSRWRKSSYSGSSNNCVEVATSGAAVTIRDSKAPDGPALTFSPQAWATFTTSIKAN